MKQQSGIQRVELLVGTVIVAATGVVIFSMLMHDATGRKGSGLSGDFAYDVEKLTKIDPAMILYEESGTQIETALQSTRAIAIDARDYLYVAGDKAIRVFDTSGAVRRTIDVPGAVECLAVSAATGLIYAGIGDHVEVYDGGGKLVAIWPSPGASAVVTSIAVSKGGDVFVADAGGRIVIRYDAEGREINRIGKKDLDRNVPGFVVPSPHFDVVVPRDGMPRVVNPGRLRIETYTVEGDYEFAWGEPSVDIEGFCGCCNPVNIALLPNDDVITCEKGLNRIKVYDHTGKFKGVVAGPEQLTPGSPAKICVRPEQCQSGGFDVAADSAGRIYVLDTAANVIRKFTLKEL
ncbi:MAG: hypothetical protein IH624_09325 [Phycisphaerae bacterium]|nr:hypothetical protein [Phycisphaerae bacterium]